ncbi:MAG TPA: type I restriction enzyme HsdR N-terminal domain-containing protein [Cytophagaceae bacterium]|jgi:predicted type IV restriction endonuclease|nr:type I restriction enzyme HsdR N-terminal domain-containing protein [Cytophagaceae bacterium]
MNPVPEKITARISEGLKKFQPIIAANKTKDVNESDTVTLIIDILSEVLGFDKYNDITTEHNIRGQYCDIALKINGKLELLLEAKAIGIELKENHIRQIIDYAVNQGLEWVILSNGLIWRIYKVFYSKPIQNILVGEINMLDLKYKNKEDLQKISILTKEAIGKNSLDIFFTQKQATNKYMLGNLLCTPNIINVIKKELRQIYPDVKVQSEEIENVLLHEVIKRELLEGEDSDNAKKKITKVIKKQEKERASKQGAATPVIISAIETDNPA